nr:hypothetical protein [Tanacetum cinerariifolium]
MAMLTVRARRFLQRAGINLRANGPISMGFDMSKVKCYNCHRKGHFARECSVMVWAAMTGVFKQMRNLPTMLLCHSHLQVLLLTMRYQSGYGYHAIPPPYTGIFMPPKPNLVFHNAPNDGETIHTAFNVKLSPTKSDKDLSPTHRPLALIKEYLVSDSEDDSEAKIPQNDPTANPKTAIPKPTSKGNSRNRKARFICKSLTHLIKDCDYHEKKMAQTTDGNHANRGNHQQYAKMKLPNPQRHVIPIAVLTQSKLVPITAVRPVTTDVPKTNVTRPRQAKPIITKPHSPPQRHINHSPSLKASNFPLKVTAVKASMVNAVKGVQGKWEWKPKCPILDHGNPQHALKDKGVIDSGCSRHMIGNMSYLSDFEAINGGYVAFSGNPKGGKISGKGKIRTGKLDFDDVYFVKELKFNLFRVSQMCDKKNSVLFTDTECLVLSPNFKLLDENQVLLRFPRENNMYNVDLKNIVPSGDLTCLFAKTTLDESNLWHRRLGHINFKIINKLVRGNLVRGLPTKVFYNDHTCVACKKGKQHRASCKTKPISSVNQPLQRLHMDLFGPTFVKILNKKSYCLVVIDDYSRFTWVFFLATKDETGPILKTFITDIENQLSLKAEAVYTACYVQNRVLVTKPKNKTPYELLHGRTPNISFMRPFSCLVTILNTLDSSGVQKQFDAEKAKEENNMCFFLWSSVSTNPQNTNGDAAFDEKEPEFEGKKLESKFNVSLSSKFEDFLDNSINKVNAVGSLVPAVGRISTNSNNTFSVASPSNTTDKGVIDSGCSRHMTGNMSYLSNFEELNGGYVTFGGNSKGGKISGKGKFDGKVDEGFLVGYSVSIKAFRVFNSRTRIVQETLHINFLENKLNVVGSGPTWMFDIDTLTKTKNYQPITASNQSNPSAGVQEQFDAAFDEKELEFKGRKPESEVNVSLSSSAQSKKHDDKTKREAKGKSPVNDAGPSNATVSPTQGKYLYVDSSQLFDDPNMPELEDITYSDDEDDVATQTRSMTRVAKDQVGLSQIYNDDFHTCMFACFLSQEEPKRVHQALKDLSWIKAMQEELLQFKMQKVWVLVDLPHGKRAIGHTQEEGVDYEEAFGPVARIKAIRLFLAYASFMGFMVYQIDVKSAFLYGTIKKEVYVCQPPGFEDPDYPNKVYEVVKALYGLHQAPKAWYETLANYLLENGFQRGKIDQTLFIKRQKGDILLVQIYVDDIIFGSTNKDLCNNFKKLIKDKFQMSLMGELTFFGSTNRKSASTPIDTEKPLLKDPDDEDVDVHTYRSMISSLMYLTSSRPDIMFAVALSSMKALKRMLHVTNIFSAGSLTTPQMVLNSPCLTHIKNCLVQIKRFLSWLVQKQTAFGKDKANLFIVDSLLKTIWLNVTVVSSSFCCLVCRIDAACLMLLDASEGFNQIIDFLNASLIKYALTINLNIYVSVIKQFWSSVLVKMVNDVSRLQALVDRKKVIITEATIRDVLRLDNAEGIECLPNEEIFIELARMGYEKPSTKLTFYKAFFSSQWKFLIYTILQCMSAKRMSWNEFSSSMASAVICLSTCRKFNFSKYIFDCLVRNVDSSTKFDMYLCFLQLMIKKQVGDLSSHTTKYTSPALTQKVFANMRRVGKGCSEVETPLFEGMIVAQQVGEGAAEVNVEYVSTAGVAAEGDASVADDEVPTAVDEPSIPSPPPPTQPPPPSQDIPFTS